MASKKRATRASSGKGSRNGHGHGASSREEHEQRPLECKLTEPEFNDRSDKMAASELLIESLKEQRKGINGRIAAATTERNRLAHIIDTRIEVRQVDCVWRDDFQKNVKRLVRTDSNAEIDTRPMTADDRQVDLGLPPVDSTSDTTPPPPPAATKRRPGRPRTKDLPVMHAH